MPSYRGGSRGRVQGVRTPPPWDDLRFSNTTGILQKKKKWFIGVEVEQETSAPPPKKNPGSAPELGSSPFRRNCRHCVSSLLRLDCVLDRTFSRHFSAYFLPNPRAKQPAEASPERALITCFLYHIQCAWLAMPCPFFLLWFVNETLTLAVVF